MAEVTVTTEQVHELIQQLAAMTAAASITPQIVANIFEKMRNLNDQEREKVIAVAEAFIARLLSIGIGGEVTESKIDEIRIETDGGILVVKIDANGADFANLKRGGQQVARMSDLPTKDSSIGENPSTTNVPTTKAVKDYVDNNIPEVHDYPIEEGSQMLDDGEHLEFSDDNGGKYTDAEFKHTSDDSEEQSWQSDDGRETYAKVTPKGMYAKTYYDMQGNPIGVNAELTNEDVRVWQFLPDYTSYKLGKYERVWYERFKILHISDTHGNNSNVVEALSRLASLVDITVDTGDNANGMPTWEASRIIAELEDYKDTVIATKRSTDKIITCSGNHDIPNLTKKQFYDVICSLYPSGFVFGDSAHYRIYGYYDITGSTQTGTIRIINLDPCDYEDGEFQNPYGASDGWHIAVFSQTQIDWLISTLRDAVTHGYKVITAMHYSFGDNPRFDEDGISANPDAHYYQDPFMIPDIIDAMQNKTTLTKTYADSANINNISIDEDFTNIGDLHFICHLFGHIHSKNDYQCQKNDGSKKYDILMLGEHNMGTYGAAINKVRLQPNTLNSIKLSVLEIDVTEQCVYRVAYGGYIAYNASETERTKKIPYRFNMNENQH